MSAKFDRFVAALEALCREHDVELCASECDYLQVWDLRPGSAPIAESLMQDRTRSSDTPGRRAALVWRAPK
jgi:hypothetical protein